MHEHPFGSEISPERHLSGRYDTNPREPELGTLPRSERDEETVNKTGTTTIGIATDHGVVIATDMRASLGGRFVSNKNVQKVEQIHPTAALTLVGSVGGAQSFIRTLRAEVNLYEARRGEHMSMKALSTLAGNFARGEALRYRAVIIITHQAADIITTDNNGVLDPQVPNFTISPIIRNTPT